MNNQAYTELLAELNTMVDEMEETERNTRALLDAFNPEVEYTGVERRNVKTA